MSRIRRSILLLALVLPAGALAGSPAYTPTNADGQVEVVLKDHRFTPAEIHVPAGKRAQLLVRNQDATADEFDSTALKVEKVIGGGSEGVVRLRALDPGRYPFMGEFHAETAQGVVIAE
ncbi:cupredoxin domain-containing protein [Labrys wisconsinensis]|uniref:Plastocyanin n=1 Tax=Labrys wisconsinensis TaxID=425677 RepID=A0ABU0J034_9HYPH|nr:cupredoxin domain-containing protein [Labrys wisconsinensis]MDQ0467621.1 plastocyanin [Labrys wisconsinensis]